MKFLEELDDLRLYNSKRKVFIPIDPSNRKKGAAIMLLSKNSVDSNTMMNLPYIHNPNLYESLYIDRNVNAYIDSGAIVDEDPDEAVTEATQHISAPKDVKVTINCRTDSPNDIKLLKEVFSENNFRKWYRFFNVSDRRREKDIIVEAYPNIKDMVKDYQDTALDNKDIINYSYSFDNRIVVVCNSGYDDAIKKKDGEYQKYLLNELITFVCMKSSASCSHYLAGQVATVLSEQFDEKKYDKIADDYGNVTDYGLATVYVIKKFYEEEGPRGIVRLVKTGDYNILTKYATKSFIKRISGLYEATLTAADRRNMKDSDYGLPSQKKYTMPDESHVRSAIRFFNHVSSEDEAELARNIKKKIKQYNMTVNVSDSNRFSKYYNEDTIDCSYFSACINEEVVVEDIITETKKTDKQYGNDRSFRRIPGWQIRMLASDIKNMHNRPKCNPAYDGKFEELHPWLLGMVEDAKTEERIKYLRADAYTGINSLTKLSKNLSDYQNGNPSRYINTKDMDKRIKQGLTVSKINSHIKWMKSTYIPAINKKSAEIRKAKNESAFIPPSYDTANLFDDVMSVVNALSDKERHDIAIDGVYKNSDRVVSRAIKRDENGSPIGFIDTYCFTSKPYDGMLTAAIKPEYRNKGYMKQLLHDVIMQSPARNPYIKRYVWHVDPNNIGSVNLAKSCGFVKDPMYARHRPDIDIDEDGYVYTIPFKENTINESVFFNKDDIVLNFDKWKPTKGNNILYVTGLSGSGKTTLAEEYEKKYNAYMFELDGLENDYDSSNRGILDKVKSRFPDYAEAVKNGFSAEKYPELKTWEDVDKKFLTPAARIALKIMEEDSDNLYIIEGLQIYYDVFPYEKLRNKPMIIKGTSVISSMSRRIKRTLDNDDGRSKAKIISDEIKQAMVLYAQSYGKLKKFERGAKKNFKESRIPIPGGKILKESFGSEYAITDDYIMNDSFITFFNGMDTQAITEAEKKYDTKLKRYLFKERLKNNKAVLLRYEQMKVMNPWIKRTFLKLPMYKRRNIFIDLSFYHGLFLKNLQFNKDQAIRMYWDFINRLLNDTEYKSIYNKITIFIPVWPEAWDAHNVDELMDYRKSINPISLIIRMLRKNPADLKKWGNKDILFVSTNGYFKVNFNRFDLSNLAKFRRFITKLYNNESIEDDETEDGYRVNPSKDMDSAAVITASIAGKIEDNTGIKIDDITGGTQVKNGSEVEKVIPSTPSFTHLRIRAEKINIGDSLKSDGSNAILILTPDGDQSVETFLDNPIDVSIFNKRGYYAP